MDFAKKEDRAKYLEEKFDNLLDVIGESYGNILMEELVSRLDTTIDQFNTEISNLFNSLTEKEVERQSLLQGISVKKKKSNIDNAIIVYSFELYFLKKTSFIK